jgi:hypothetical protein
MSNATVSGDTSAHRMRVDRVSSRTRAVLIVVANPAISSNNGWPVGLWAAELTHPYYELTEAGVRGRYCPARTAARWSSMRCPILATPPGGRPRT